MSMLLFFFNWIFYIYFRHKVKNYGNFFLQSLAAVALPVSMFSKPLMVQMQILIWNMFCIFKVFMCVRTVVIFPFRPHLLGKMHTKKLKR